jgi:gas vesicle protein
MKTFGYIATFLGGAIAGAAIGLLLAPEKGADTRTKIADTVDDFCKKHDIKLNRNDADDLVDDIKEAVDADKA